VKNRKAVIVIDLIEESAETAKEKIEREIFEELSKGYIPIPWQKAVEKVTVTET